METPSSARRVTRSQTLAASANKSNLPLSRKVEDSEKTMTKSRQGSGKKQQQDRSALIDITNDSPIVGLAKGNLETPSSAMSKMRMSTQGKFVRTPGSGEALLRGQVKTLLQKVEEEAEVSKITLENRPLFNLQALINSPMNFAAPTPANTPQVLTFSANSDDLPSVTPSMVNEELLIPKMITEMLDETKEEDKESDNLITRSLLLDFSEKSETSEISDCASVMTYQGTISGDTESSREKLSTDDDDASIWSIQVNASSIRDDEEVEEECDDDYYFEEEEEEEEEDDDEGGDDFVGDNDEILDELCEGMSKISVKEGPKFMGKHIRFVYNSDDEGIEGEEEVCGGCEFESSAASSSSSPSRKVLRLKGLPTPKGKHLRFPQESQDD